MFFKREEKDSFLSRGWSLAGPEVGERGDDGGHTLSQVLQVGGWARRLGVGVGHWSAERWDCRAEAVYQALGSQLAFHGELKGTIYRPPRLGFLLRIQSQMWND